MFSFSSRYRAKYIHQTAQSILERYQSQQSWIDTLGRMNYGEAKEALMSLPGVGAKVADCICLMGLGHTQSVPVDTHILQITVKNYEKELVASIQKDEDSTGQAPKTMTKKRYDQIGNFYRARFPRHAGWAQTVLFCSNLGMVKNHDSKETKKKKVEKQEVEGKRKRPLPITKEPDLIKKQRSSSRLSACKKP